MPATPVLYAAVRTYRRTYAFSGCRRCRRRRGRRRRGRHRVPRYRPLPRAAAATGTCTALQTRLVAAL